MGGVSSLFTFIHSAFARALGLAMILAILMLCMPEVGRGQTCPCSAISLVYVAPPTYSYPLCVDTNATHFCTDCHCRFLEAANNATVPGCAINEIDITGPDKNDCVAACCWFKDIWNGGGTQISWKSNAGYDFGYGCQPESILTFTQPDKAYPQVMNPCYLGDNTCTIDLIVCTSNPGLYTFTFHFTDGTSCPKTM